MLNAIGSMSRIPPQPCACGIDVHAHIVPESFPPYLGRSLGVPWPNTTSAPPINGQCHRHVLVGGKHYRTINEACWSAPRRLADLPEMGLSQQIVSPMPELLSYWMSVADAAPLIRYLNEQTAAMVAESSGRLLGMAVVPLQDLDASIAELTYARERLGLVAVEIGSNINGLPIGDVSLDPFYAACVAMNLPVFVHALKPTGMDRLLGPAALQQVLAYPTDVGLAAASVITAGLLQRHPSLRIAFSHGGGTLVSLLPRLQRGWQTFSALAERMRESPMQTAKRLYFDTLVFEPTTLAHLLACFGSQGLMVGTDHPFAFHESQPLALLAKSGLDVSTLESLAFGNARRFLGQVPIEMEHTL